MSEIAVRVEGLGKKYYIGGPRAPYKTIRESLTKAVLAPVRWFQGDGRGFGSRESIWALKDLSFEVKRGEVVGIIGRNGAGKTTLLKILSRITEPTEGCAEVRGRVGSLLEVGTGFHPELTGRENVYLNGAILGMKRAEIERKFDEIVAFAEIEKFLDTPVKRYSSGMYVRLAFAVAAHLEPEILLVDEVLAVGDVTFQKKCLGKMGDVAREGRTVLFVSHNMVAINRLCRHGMLLEEGRLRQTGPPESIVAAYVATEAASDGERRWVDPEGAPGNEKIRLRSVRVLNSHGVVASTLENQSPFYVEIEYDIFRPLSGIQVGFWLVTSDGVTVLAAGDIEQPDQHGKARQPATYISRCEIPGRLLNSGSYSLAVGADISFIEQPFFQENTVRFNIEQTTSPSFSLGRPPGLICPPLRWCVSERH